MTLGIPKASLSAGATETRPAEAESGHLAREFHDLVAQPLVSLVLEIHELRNNATDPQAATELADLEDTARWILRNTRELLLDMRGQDDIRLNFREVLENELRSRSAGRTATPPAIHVSSSWPERINGWAAFNLLRIVQEAVANAIRHGRAKRVEVVLGTSTEEAVVIVADDGFGLGDSPSGIGMVGMQERAVILGGKFSAVQRTRGGTQVEVRVPLEQLT